MDEVLPNLGPAPNSVVLPQEILAAESWRSTPYSDLHKYLYKYIDKGGGWRNENHRKRKRGEFEMGGSC